jgi:hypothetical protein
MWSSFLTTPPPRTQSQQAVLVSRHDAAICCARSLRGKVPASSFIQIGKPFFESKQQLSHGVFLRWVEWEVGRSGPHGYMRIANWASGKSAIVAHFSLSASYLLSVPGDAQGLSGRYFEPIARRRACRSVGQPRQCRLEIRIGPARYLATARKAA